jgi:hypothetical protein
MAPSYFDIESTATTWTTNTPIYGSSPMYWSLYNQTPTATNTVTWIPVNQTTSATTITYPIFMHRIMPVVHHWSNEPRNQFVPCTPAIIRRLTDRHDREELAAAAEAQRQAILERQRIEREARASAVERAKELLLAHLTSEQRHTFEQNKWFIVEGGKTKRKYKIHANGGLNANIEVVGENHRLCAHCDHHIMPYNDHVLMQKVMLELDEDSFLRVANRHPHR